MAVHARHVFVLLLVVLGGAQSTSHAADDVPPILASVEGRHFRIQCHFDGPELAREALVLAEAAWRPTVELLGVEPELAEKIEIHLMRDPAAYRAIEDTITAGKFERNNAFSSWDTKSAYVAVEPTMSDDVLKRVGLVAQTHRGIVHEAAHLIVYRAWPHFRHHPNWLAEGIAVWVADQALVPGASTKALAGRPFSSTRMIDFRRIIENGELPAIGEALKDQYGELDFYQRYAFWWGFWRFVYLEGPYRRGMRAVLGGMPERTNGGAFKGELLTAMTKLLGDKGGGFATFERRLRAWAAKLSGDWEERNRTLTVRGDEWWQLGFQKTNAVCWRSGAVGRKTYRIAGRMEILGRSNPQMNVLLGRVADEGFISIAFRAGVGVTIFRYEEEDNRWANLAFGSAPKLAPGKSTPFAVHVANGRVTAFLAGKQICTTEVGAHPLQGEWGVGVQAGGAGIWRGVKLRR